MWQKIHQSYHINQQLLRWRSFLNFVLWSIRMDKEEGERGLQIQIPTLFLIVSFFVVYSLSNMANQSESSYSKPLTQFPDPHYSYCSLGYVQNPVTFNGYNMIGIIIFSFVGMFLDFSFREGRRTSACQYS